MARGRYTIVGKLANGGMAEIFLAKQYGAEGFQKPVVLKRVLSAFSADPQFRNMFIDEAHISMGLAHGNIVQVLDVGVAGERMFLVLELVEGWDLDQVMARAQAAGPDHPWPPSLALFVGAQICRALAYAHARRGADGRALGIIHRDVSPTNILISEQGEVKLTDFGIAKASRKREQTAAGVIKGKIGFMSPEQALGRTLDARADLFSLGTVLYLMLTGRKPFEASTDLEALTRAQKADYRPPEQLNPYLPRNTTAILNRAMQREVADRYQTADEMLLDLEKVLRTQYHSAGQSELKRWLAELARRDGQAPMSRAREAENTHTEAAGASAADAAARSQVELANQSHPMVIEGPDDLSAGSSLELSDDEPAVANRVRIAAAKPPFAVPAAAGVDAHPATLIEVAAPAGRTSGAPPPPAAAFAPTTRAPQMFPEIFSARPSPPASTPPAGAPKLSVGTGGVPTPRRFWRRGRPAAGFLVGGLCVFGAVVAIRSLAEWAGQEVRPAPVRPVAATTTTAAAQNARRPPGDESASAPAMQSNAPPERDGAARDTPDERPDRNGDGAAAGRRDRANAGDAAPPPDVDGTTPTPRSGVAAVTKSPPRDRDRDRDLDHDRSAPGARTADEKPRGPSSTPRKPATPSEGPVMVRIASSPPGAVVRTRNRVLGHTPVAVRLTPGITYQLVFTKAGYVTTARPFTVEPGKSGNVSVALKKKPAAPAHFFFRGR